LKEPVAEIYALPAARAEQTSGRYLNTAEFISRLNDPRTGEIEILIGKFLYRDAITANRGCHLA
jgi:hypothetical protein